MALSTTLAPFCPKFMTAQLNTSLEQVTFTAATPTSVRIKLVQVTPEEFRKCRTPVPAGGTLKEKLRPVMFTQLLPGQPTGSRTITAGSTAVALAATANSATTIPRITTFIVGFTLMLLAKWRGAAIGTACIASAPFDVQTV